MNLVEIHSLSEQEEARAQDFILAQCFKRSKRKGDGAWREAAEITGDGDYIPGVDDGEPPQGAKW